MGKSSNPFKSIKKSAKSFEGFVSHAGKQLDQNLKNFGEDINWTSIREGVTAAGIAAAAIYIGGAAYGAVAGTGAKATAAAALGSAAAGSIVANQAIKGFSGEEQRKDVARAEAEYNAKIQKAEAEALQKRKANLLSTKKQLSPKVGKSYVMGGAGQDDILTTNKLG